MLWVVYAPTWEVSTLKNSVDPPLRRRLARIERCVFTTEKTCAQRSYTVITNVTAKSLNFCPIKLVKEENLTLCNTQFPAGVILQQC